MQQDDELLDYTDLFVATLKKLAPKDGFGGINWTIGTAGAGKSALMCILFNLLLTFSEKRNVALYQAPSNLLKEIQRAIPRDKLDKDRFRIVERLSEVQKFDILGLDEGYLSADAKDFLTRKSRNFIQSLTTLRHQSVISILNSLDNGILRGYRLKAQFRFYKLLPDGYIDEINDRFAKRYGDVITNLLPEQTIFQITHVDFLRRGIRRGALVMKLKDFCSWYNDRISRNFEGEDFDAAMRKLRKKKERMEEVIKLLIDTFGKDVTPRLAKGFLFDQHEILFNEFQDDIDNIVNVVKSRIYFQEKKLEIALENERKKINIPEIIEKSEIDDACANFFKAYYFKNLPFDQYKKTFLDIIYLWILGFSQRKIAYETGYSLTTVNHLLQKYNSGLGLNSDLLRTKTVYEFWIARATGGKRGGGQSEPDIWYFNKENKIIGCGECKLIDDVSTTLTFYLQSLGNRKNKKITLQPAFEYCKENGIKCFPLFLRNPKWANADLIIPIRVVGDNKITISKANITSYISTKGVQSFDPHEFFLHQENIFLTIN
ncbi:MAG: hypothetical protein ACTSRH_08605 [Promethearchaeota archaeon]